jgi:hypothetical protein
MLDAQDLANPAPFHNTSSGSLAPGRSVTDFTAGLDRCQPVAEFQPSDPLFGQFYTAAPPVEDDSQDRNAGTPGQAEVIRRRSL